MSICCPQHILVKKQSACALAQTLCVLIIKELVSQFLADVD